MKERLQFHAFRRGKELADEVHTSFRPRFFENVLDVAFYCCYCDKLPAGYFFVRITEENVWNKPDFRVR